MERDEAWSLTELTHEKMGWLESTHLLQSYEYVGGGGFTNSTQQAKMIAATALVVAMSIRLSWPNRWLSFPATYTHATTGAGSQPFWMQWGQEDGYPDLRSKRKRGSQARELLLVECAVQRQQLPIRGMQINRSLLHPSSLEPTGRDCSTVGSMRKVEGVGVPIE
jgi:hypothetical protein